MRLSVLLTSLVIAAAGNAVAREVIFQSGFETESDFDQFYITPTSPDGDVSHKLTDRGAFNGKSAYQASVLRANRPSDMFTNRNHRAYPTVQFYKTKTGAPQTPICSTIYIWADFDLKKGTNGGEDQWISLATFTDDASDHWKRTVLVNVRYDGLVHLQHTPFQGQQVHEYQSSNAKLRSRRWERIDIELNLSGDGYAKVWLNTTLASHAKVKAMQNIVAQAHFGLYAAPSVDNGTIKNDDLKVVAGKCFL